MSGRSSTLILGATSDIARALARKLAGQGVDLHLAGRDMAELDALRRDLMLRGEVAVSIHDFDVLRDDSGLSLLEELPRLPDVAVCMVGLLLPQPEADAGASERVLRTNLMAPMLLMSELATRFRRRGSGVLVGVSSVAGDRGRASNYVYGSAKAGFTAFLSGLRADVASSGVHVLTVKPGFVKTRMTEGMDLPVALTAEASEVADAILVGIRRRRNTVYVRRVWYPIMLLIRSIPEAVFKRLPL
ncbi:MAG: SDR family oxidoreductase [Gammaproteobacteria bacterium]|nr:SDR family oxidoreductase [Gammaproteobacteria bacterium]